MTLGSTGPVVQIDGFGTGFLASSRGQILTNRHVVEPWWQNDEIGETLKQGLEPFVAEMTAYFPGVTHSIPVTVDRISSEADIAVVKGDFANLNIKPLTLDDRPGSAVSGRSVILLGYPTALAAILARAGEDIVSDIVASSRGDEKQFLGELARRNLIRPISTQGHIGDVLRDKLIYDAQTTSGGSGGPLFNADGKVIGINFAMLRQFGGSNFAIPARYAKSVISH
jgi:S1-C subfamily serine protease